MLPKLIQDLSEKLRLFPGIGRRSSQKLALDVLDLSKDDFEDLVKLLSETREKVHFCKNCGFFAEEEECTICLSKSRKKNQVCIVEKATDIISVEKSNAYNGTYHVLNKLISPLDNVFAEDTTIAKLIDKVEKLTKESKENVEIVLFLKAGFASEATTAYIKEMIAKKNYKNIEITRLAQGLPLYYNPDTLDQATMAKALEDRRIIN